MSLKNLQIAEEATNKLFERFSNNYTVANSDKCHLLARTSEKKSAKTKKWNQQKHLGIVIGNSLTFKSHVENLCKKSKTETPCFC